MIDKYTSHTPIVLENEAVRSMDLLDDVFADVMWLVPYRWIRRRLSKAPLLPNLQLLLYLTTTTHYLLLLLLTSSSVLQLIFIFILFYCSWKRKVAIVCYVAVVHLLLKTSLENMVLGTMEIISPAFY